MINTGHHQLTAQCRSVVRQQSRAQQVEIGYVGQQTAMQQIVIRQSIDATQPEILPGHLAARASERRWHDTIFKRPLVQIFLPQPLRKMRDRLGAKGQIGAQRFRRRHLRHLQLMLQTGLWQLK